MLSIFAVLLYIKFAIVPRGRFFLQPQIFLAIFDKMNAQLKKVLGTSASFCNLIFFGDFLDYLTMVTGD